MAAKTKDSQKLLIDGELSLKKGDLEKAEQYFKSAVEMDDNDQAHLGLGMTYRAMNRHEDSERAYYEAIRANPHGFKAYLLLARLLTDEERLEDAYEVYSQAAATADGLTASGKAQASILFFMGEVKLGVNLLQEAMSHFDEAVELDPENAELQTKIGDTLAAAGHLEESEKFYKEALAMDPSLAHIYNRLGVTYRKQAKYGLALKLYERALSFSPDDEHLLFNQARCQWESGDFDAAGTALQSALSLNPDFMEAKALLKAVEKGVKPKPA